MASLGNTVQIKWGQLLSPPRRSESKGRDPTARHRDRGPGSGSGQPLPGSGLTGTPWVKVTTPLESLR